MVRWDEIFKKKMISYILVKNAIGWIQPSFNLKIDVCEHNLQANEICQVGKTRRKGAKSDCALRDSYEPLKHKVLTIKLP